VNRFAHGNLVYIIKSVLCMHLIHADLITLEAKKIRKCESTLRRVHLQVGAHSHDMTHALMHSHNNK